MKIIAFYLPQFHEIPENNKWWGEGFTDWTNVKKAKPLFTGHYQPREPLYDNYYDLTDVETMKWQSKIAQENGLYGFCYYHYWFNGKLLLEKPLENMLNCKDVTIPFCFSWANEPWARTWDGKDSDVLMPQVYGDKKDWKDHFEYLLKFFKDNRYIKEKNKPMIVIYKTMHIPRVEEMCIYWNKLAQDNGFDGLYIVETLGGVQKSPCLNISEGVIEFEPNYTMASLEKLGFLKRLKNKLYKFFGQIIIPKNYDYIWSKILARETNRFNKKMFLGAFIDWDNSPRKGFRSTVFVGSEPSKFGDYISKQIDRSEADSYIFINAWNEWAEGTYLEPDRKFGLGYLESLKRALDK